MPRLPSALAPSVRAGRVPKAPTRPPFLSLLILTPKTLTLFESILHTNEERRPCRAAGSIQTHVSALCVDNGLLGFDPWPLTLTAPMWPSSDSEHSEATRRVNQSGKHLWRELLGSPTVFGDNYSHSSSLRQSTSSSWYWIVIWQSQFFNHKTCPF